MNLEGQVNGSVFYGFNGAQDTLQKSIGGQARFVNDPDGVGSFRDIGTLVVNASADGADHVLGRVATARDTQSQSLVPEVMVVYDGVEHTLHRYGIGEEQIVRNVDGVVSRLRSVVDRRKANPVEPETVTAPKEPYRILVVGSFGDKVDAYFEGLTGDVEVTFVRREEDKIPKGRYQAIFLNVKTPVGARREYAVRGATFMHGSPNAVYVEVGHDNGVYTGRVENVKGRNGEATYDKKVIKQIRPGSVETVVVDLLEESMRGYHGSDGSTGATTVGVPSRSVSSNVTPLPVTHPRYDGKGVVVPIEDGSLAATIVRATEFR